jgi:hypothetical protein
MRLKKIQPPSETPGRIKERLNNYALAMEL